RAHAVRGPVPRAAHGRTGQAAVAEAAGRDVVGGDAGRLGALVDRRPGLPADRVDPVVPAQAVQQLVLTGDRDLVSEHAVLAGRAAGTERGQAGHRGGRETGGQRLGGHGQLVQERGGGGVGPPQV